MHSKIGGVTLVVIIETIILVSFLTSTHLRSDAHDFIYLVHAFQMRFRDFQPKYYFTWYLDQNGNLSNGLQGPLLLTWINFNPSMYK